MLPLMKLTALVVTVSTILFINLVPSDTAITVASNATSTTSAVEYQAIEGKMEGKSCTCYCPSNSESNSRSSGCFASDTLVTLINHQKIPIRQLRPTDELLTSDGKAVLTTEMMMMLDKNAVVQTLFHTLVTASGHRVSLTELHLIPIVQQDGSLNYIPAKDVKVDDVMNVMSDDNHLELSPVVEVIVEMKTGFYAPLTTSGSLLANGVMASCFSNVKSHEAAQWHMRPLRWYYWMAQSLSINEPFGSQNTDGMHFIPHMMYEFGRFFRPSTLRFS